jgi:hypothetical protein
MQDSRNPSTTAQLDATIQALQGGNLAGLAPQASANIQSWISILQHSNNGQLSGIASELERLNDALAGSTPDTLQVQQSLRTLGEHTLRAAESADPGSQDKVRQLGEALNSAASQIH